jgi:MoaA/NifB/PqqE/SkfB family radical SAM enzyme
MFMDQLPVSGHNGYPVLNGYTFSDDMIYEAVENKRLLSIHIEINSHCNLQCRYCHFRTNKSLNAEIDIAKLLRIVDKAKSLGALSVVITGGEPTLHGGFKELIEFINKCQMIPVIFTNAISISQNSARFLYDNNVSVMARLDSFRPSVQDQLSGFSGSYVLIHAGLHNLFEAGFTNISDNEHLRLGISFISSRLNKSEIEEIWHFCRRNKVYPNFEVRQKKTDSDVNFEDLLSEDEIEDFKVKLFEIDSQIYDYKQMFSSHQRSSVCLKPLYNFYVTVDGNVCPCLATRLNEPSYFSENGEYLFNINRLDLDDIFNSRIFDPFRETLSRVKVNGDPHLFINDCTSHCGFLSGR